VRFLEVQRAQTQRNYNVTKAVLIGKALKNVFFVIFFISLKLNT